MRGDDMILDLGSAVSDGYMLGLEPVHEDDAKRPHNLACPAKVKVAVRARHHCPGKPPVQENSQ